MDTLPEGWRLGRLQNNHRILFFNNTWVAKIKVDDEFQQNVENFIENPTPRAFPELFKASELSVSSLGNEQGVRNLVKEGLINPEDALILCPSIKAWLKRNKLWSEDKSENQVHHNDKVYECRNHTWYIKVDGETSMLRRKAYFPSVWDARVAYAKGECSLEDIAEYSWGALFEVVQDQMLLFDASNLKLLSTFKAVVYREILTFLPKIHNTSDICAFHKNGLSNMWVPEYYLDPIMRQADKYAQFWELMEQVLRLDLSGYAARLIFTNALNKRVRTEKRRWYQTKTVYVPYLSNKQNKIDKMSLEKARDWVQKHQLDMITLGIISPENTVTAFTHRGNRYGLYILSGKLFSLIEESAKYIPKDFDSWSEEKQRAFLNEDYERLKEIYCKRLRAFRRLYYYLKNNQKLSSKQSWAIATRKHLKLQREFLERKRSAARWNCAEVNRTAITMTYTLPKLRLEVA